jgi:hypothetical protein
MINIHNHIHFTSTVISIAQWVSVMQPPSGRHHIQHHIKKCPNCKHHIAWQRSLLQSILKAMHLEIYKL